MARKRRILLDTAERRDILREFMAGKSRERRTSVRFELPLLVIKNTSKAIIQVEHGKLCVRSQQSLELLSDMDCLRLVCESRASPK